MIYSVLCASEHIQKESGQKLCFYRGRLFNYPEKNKYSSIEDGFICF